MNDPFMLLEVAPGAGDAEIKKAYLAKVREFPPERAPERFQAIHRAYESIKTPKARLAYALFHREIPDASALCQHLLQETKEGQPDEELFQRMLAETVRG